MIFSIVLTLGRSWHGQEGIDTGVLQEVQEKCKKTITTVPDPLWDQQKFTKDTKDFSEGKYTHEIHLLPTLTQFCESIYKGFRKEDAIIYFPT